MKKGLILSLIIFAGIALLGVSQYIGYHNTWTDKKNLYEEQLEVDKVIYDKVWKVIQQQAQVSEKYAEDFKSIYTDIMSERYENGGGKLMLWIQEQNPEFSQDMYMKLMNTIEVQRGEFAVNQKRLVSIHKELKNLKEKFPSNIFLGGKELPELVTITSTKTEKTFESGKEDEVNLFN
jgi:alpha-L-fucosidase